MLSLLAGVLLSLATAPPGAVGELRAPVDHVASLRAPGSGQGAQADLASLEIDPEEEEEDDDEGLELDSGLACEHRLWVIAAERAAALPSGPPSIDPLHPVASHSPRGPPRA